MARKTKTPGDGDQAPAFTLHNKDGNQVSLEDFQEKWVVLYFYPKDNTSGCTTEAIDFSSARTRFKRLGAEILGVSPDSARSHRNFTEKHDLKITLLSDPEHTVLKAFGAWGKKKMYGREYEGVIRSTYLIAPSGTIARAWIKVKVKGHVEEVLASLRELKG